MINQKFYNWWPQVTTNTVKHRVLSLSMILCVNKKVKVKNKNIEKKYNNIVIT